MHISGQGTLMGGSITVPLTSCLTGLESAAWQLTIFVFIFKTDSSKQVKQEVNCTVILPPLVFPALVLHSSAGSWAFPKKTLDWALKACALNGVTWVFHGRLLAKIWGRGFKNSKICSSKKFQFKTLEQRTLISSTVTHFRRLTDSF
jgi:hypothetical protein